MRRPIFIGILAASTLLVGCGDGSENTRTTDTTTPRSTQVPPEGNSSGEGGSPVIVIDHHGGFVPPETNLANTPDVVLLGDGTLITPAPVVAIYPGPALVSFQQTQVSTDTVRELLAAAQALDPDADYEPTGDVMIADAPFTTVTIFDDDEVRTITVYAYSHAAGSGPRKAFAGFIDSFADLSGSDDALYEPKAFVVRDATPFAGDPGSDPIAGEVRDIEWPLAVPVGDCVTVTASADVAALAEVLSAARSTDWFTTPQGRLRLVVSVLLPGAAGCTDTTG